MLHSFQLVFLVEGKCFIFFSPLVSLSSESTSFMTPTNTVRGTGGLVNNTVLNGCGRLNNHDPWYRNCPWKISIMRGSWAKKDK